MRLSTVILNGKTSFPLIVSNDVENILYSNAFTEQFFNVGLITTKHKQLLLEYIQENNEKFVKVDIQVENKLYKDVYFKIVETDNNTIESTFNPAHTKPIISPIKDEKPILEENYDVQVIGEPAPVIKLPPAPVKDEIKYEPLKDGKFYEVAINSTIPATFIENSEIENILFCRSFTDQLFNVGIFKTRDSELISDYVIENDEKYVYIDLLFENGDLYHKIKFKVILIEGEDIPLSMFNLKTLDEKTKSYVQFTGTQVSEKDFKPDEPEEVILNIEEDDELRIKKEKYELAISKARELERKINEQKLHLIQQQEDISKKETILGASKDIEEIVWESVSTKLDDFKKELYTTFKDASKKDLDEYIVQKLDEDFKLSVNIEEKVKELVTYHKDILVVEKDIKKFVNESVERGVSEARKYARRILDLGGGGGTVAVQYANGGVMDGTLDVRGQYLSAGIDLLAVINQAGANQTLAYNEASYDLTISSSNTVSLSSINTTFKNNSANYESTFTSVKNNSSKWDSTYTTFNINSATYAKSSDVYGNFLPLSGGTIDGSLSINKNLTVYGNLTALGDSYFVNTVFTTTSALSVINTGHGPALYVFQAAGPYDVASFYDGDGVEVLHVGNAAPGGLGRVGINESYPTVELTVNGSISSNNTIFTIDGNSNNWNSVYTSVSPFSASWNSVYTSVVFNSGDWNSVYNSWHTLSSEYVTVHYLSTNNVLLSAATVADDINVGGTGYFRHVAAATKSFYISHPSKPGLHLQYGSLESPYHGVRLTGKSSVKTSRKIQLPDYIKHLVTGDGVNIQLTNINHIKPLYISEINVRENYFVVSKKTGFFAKNKEYEFFWTFTAIRKDIPELQVEI